MLKIHIVPHFSSCIVNTFINCSSLCFSVSSYRKGKFQIIKGSGCKSVSRNVDLDYSTHPYWSLVAATFYKWRLKTDVFESAPLSGFKCTALTCILACKIVGCCCTQSREDSLLTELLVPVLSVSGIYLLLIVLESTTSFTVFSPGLSMLYASLTQICVTWGESCTFCNLSVHVVLIHLAMS